MFQASTLISLIITYRYFILFPIACVEGPFLALIIGFLVHFGYLGFVPSFLILIFGDIIPDTAYFYMGRAGNKRNIVEKYSPRLKIISGSFAIVEKLWKHHPRKTMFFSKLAYGLSIPFLISAGLVKMSFRDFISYTIPATLFQYGVLMTVGYYLGKSYNLATKYVEMGYFLMAGVLVLFIVGYVLMSKYSLREIKKLENEEDKNIIIN